MLPALTCHHFLQSVLAMFTEAVAAENGLNGILHYQLCDLDVLQTEDANLFVLCLPLDVFTNAI